MTKEVVCYHVTGTDRQGRRFKRVYTGKQWAMGINLYNGSVWEVYADGTRKRIKRVIN